MKRKRIYIFVGIIFIAVLFIIFLQNIFKDKVYIKTDLVKKDHIQKYINLIGEVASDNVKNYYLSNEKNNEIKVKIGQKIINGDTIATSPYGNVVSDSNGVITNIEQVGLGFAGTTNTKITVQDIENLKVVVDVNKNDDNEIKIGQKAIIIGNNGEEIRGEVSFRNPVAEKSKSITDNESYVKTEVQILERTENFTIGFSNEVNILVGEVDDILVIPIEAVENEKGNINYVYVFKDNILEKRKVELGLEGECEVQVISGVNEGEEIVLNPTSNLSNIKKVYRREQ